MFAWNCQDDFFAGYDHGKQAGTMSIAGHNIVQGKWCAEAEKYLCTAIGRMTGREFAVAEGAVINGGGGGAKQSPRLRSANAHRMIGLGYLGLGDTAKAKAELVQAVEISPDLLGAGTALASLK